MVIIIEYLVVQSRSQALQAVNGNGRWGEKSHIVSCHKGHNHYHYYEYRQNSRWAHALFEKSNDSELKGEEPHEYKQAPVEVCLVKWWKC